MPLQSALCLTYSICLYIFSPHLPSIVYSVEVKKEADLPAETVKQEERETASKTPAPAPPSKPPPEKRARLQ